jgi:hypothetical protein
MIEARMRKKNSKLSPIVTLNNTFSIPRLAVKKAPASPPDKPPSPAPLLCNTTLAISAIDVIINEMYKNISTRSLLKVN